MHSFLVFFREKHIIDSSIIMRNFQQKNKWKDFLQSKPVLYLFGFFVVIFIWNMFGFIKKANDTANNRRIAEEKIANLKKEKDKLTLDIDKLKTDKGVEESIREKFGLVKEGEGVIVVVDDKNAKNNTENNESKGFFANIMGWFK